MKAIPPKLSTLGPRVVSPSYIEASYDAVSASDNWQQPIRTTAILLRRVPEYKNRALVIYHLADTPNKSEHGDQTL